MFTPGPWVVDQDEHRYSASHHVRSYIRTTKDCCPPLNLNYAVAEVSALTFSEEEQKGNARLIAAAPELLDALEDILNNGGTSAGEWCPLKYVRNAQNIIKKARGK